MDYTFQPEVIQKVEGILLSVISSKQSITFLAQPRMEMFGWKCKHVGKLWMWRKEMILFCYEGSK